MRGVRQGLQVLLLVGLFSTAARAEIGVVLADPTTIGVSPWTHAGHSLVYLSGVCADTPVHARLCRPGEQGSIVTMYPDFYEDEPYGWNMVPVSLYLQGSLHPGHRLLYASSGIKEALELHARDGVLAPVCQPAFCEDAPHHYWHDLVAATVDRDIFIYSVASTRAQDEAAVRWLNDRPNVNHYRSLTHNCSDFTRLFLDSIYPRSVHRDFLNDLAMMSPKAAARSFTHWAVKRPGLDFTILHVAQQPGPMPRAGIARSGTEDGIHMKKYLIPAALIGDHEVAGSFLVAYYLTGRFGLYKEYGYHPVAGIVQQEDEAATLRKQGREAEALLVDSSIEQERASVLGERQTWQGYREQFAQLLAVPRLQPVIRGLPLEDGTVSFPAWFSSGVVTVDDAGDAWLARGPESLRRVGVGSANLLADTSDPEMAAQLILARVSYALRAKDHYRETLPEFKQDWVLLQAAIGRLDYAAPAALEWSGKTREMPEPRVAVRTGEPAP